MSQKKQNNQTVNRRLLTIPEPRLMFDNGQTLENPKDGLLLFGPEDKPIGIQYGVVGTEDGIARFKTWAKKLRGVVAADPEISSSVTFPGFETIFRTSWNTEPRITITVEEAALQSAVKNTDSHQRVFDTVDIFAAPIRRWVKEEDPKVSLWFVVVPEYVWEKCRPNSIVSKTDGIEPEIRLSHAKAMALLQAPDFFDEVNEAAEKHLYHNHFHNQLKAKILDCEAVIQIVRESTIAPYDFLNKKGKPKRKVQDDATIAWNLSTAIYYKSGAKPWSLADIRDGVCYIGLVFKRTNNPKKQYEACCGAQMFLHSGEGMVFKGSVGPWASDKLGDYHLTEDKAAEIVRQCLATYKSWHGKNPKEVFIHGRTVFNQDEIKGFQKAVSEGTEITGIQIRRPNDLKLFREGRRAVLRGLALKLNSRNAFLWTSGYIPQLLTYPGREIPTPLKVKIVFGKTSIEQVLEDIMGLTKLNFNTCIYADGFPVTLRFADDIGEILTAIPDVVTKPLPFRHYI
jgi:hypothetical protein